MTGAQFERLRQWHLATPGRSVDIKMKQPLIKGDPEITICCCSVDEGIAIEWITPDEIENMEEILHTRALKRALADYGRQQKLIEKLTKEAG